MKKIRRINYDDRNKIKTLLDQGESISSIAKKVGFHKSSISREIRKNRGERGYRYEQAHKKSVHRQAWRKNPRKLDEDLCAKIEEKIRLYWTPETIANRFKLENCRSVCSETIYKYIYKNQKSEGDLWSFLPRAHRKRNKRLKSRDTRGKIPNTRSIHKRSAGANNRSRLGHFERDMMLGSERKGGILAIVCRKSRLIKIGYVPEKNAVATTALTLQLLKPFDVRSITNDRGREFADHVNLEKKIKAPVYFCDPYSSYQRGTNENRIGALRKFFPKKTSLKNVTQEKLKEAEDFINHRPMKCLGWKTPFEVYFGCAV